MVGTTRRDAPKLGGGAVLAALLAAGADDGMSAQESSPAAAAGDGLEGRYLVVRLRTIKPARAPEELVALIRDGFVPLLRDVPGFVGCVVVANPDTRDQLSVGIFADKAGADDSTRRAAERGRGGANDPVEGDPIVVEGPIDIAANV